MPDRIQLSMAHRGVGSVEAWIYVKDDKGKLKMHRSLGELEVKDGIAELPTFLLPGEYLVLQANDDIAW
ncbi:MAG: hypothetical protein PHQ43_05460 [Dehalococcoidales bacterium]|nr:hypothetical protein [Dehalococcoidales bacterium]